MKLRFVSLFLFTFWLFTSYSQNLLPDNIPSDFFFRRSSNGGLSGIVNDLIVSKDSCVFIEKRIDIITSHKKFKLSEKEFKEFYQVLKKNEFDKIIFHWDGIQWMDGGSSTITAKWNNNKNSIELHLSMGYKTEMENQWKNIRDYLNKFIAEKCK